MKWLAISFTILMSGLVACDRGETAIPQEQVDAVDRDDHSQQTRGYSKSDGWPEDIDRIVSMAPNITEILFALGLGDKVVAVTRYCDFPREASERDTIGGMLDPDFEAILAAEPDVVLGTKDGADHRVTDKFDRAGVEFGFLAVDDLDSVRRVIERLGGWLGVEDRAESVLADFDEELLESRNQVREVLEADGQTALLIYDREPIVAAGPGSFGGELLELAGLNNGIDDQAGAYPVLDVEKVLRINPAIIIDVKIGADSDVVHDYWGQFESLDAVKQDRVVHIDDPVMMRPGPRIPTAVERLGEAVEAL